MPVGGWAKGMLKYSETSAKTDAACPSTGPLLVVTVCPTVQESLLTLEPMAKGAVRKDNRIACLTLIVVFSARI